MMPLGTEVGLGPGHTLLDGDPALSHEKGDSSPYFWAYVYCGQTAARRHTSSSLTFLTRLIFRIVSVLDTTT